MVTVSVSPITFLSNSMQTTTVKTVTLGFTSVKDIITALSILLYCGQVFLSCHQRNDFRLKYRGSVNWTLIKSDCQLKVNEKWLTFA